MATAVKVQPLAQRAAWKALEAHHDKISNVPLRTLFSDDPQRAARFTIEAAGLFLDFSKNRITEETRKLLFLQSYGARLDLRSFPTRRSSNLRSTSPPASRRAGRT